MVGRIAVCEGHLHPFSRWEDMGPGAGELFSRLRTPGAGEQLVLRENFFIEQVLPGGMNRPLTAAEHDAYREPFPTPRDRLPVLRWIQQIPVNGDPADVDAAVRRNQDVLLRGPVPRLLLHGEPGSVVGAAELDWCRRDSAGLEIVNVGAGTHFLPEDQPEAISRALTAWLARLKKAVSPLRPDAGRKSMARSAPLECASLLDRASLMSPATVWPALPAI